MVVIDPAIVEQDLDDIDDRGEVCVKLSLNRLSGNDPILLAIIKEYVLLNSRIMYYGYMLMVSILVHATHNNDDLPEEFLSRGFVE